MVIVLAQRQDHQRPVPHRVETRVREPHAHIIAGKYLPPVGSVYLIGVSAIRPVGDAQTIAGHAQSPGGIGIVGARHVHRVHQHRDERPVRGGDHVDVLVQLGDMPHHLDGAVILPDHIDLRMLGLKGLLQLLEGDHQAASGKDHQRGAPGRAGREAECTGQAQE